MNKNRVEEIVSSTRFLNCTAEKRSVIDMKLVLCVRFALGSPYVSLTIPLQNEETPKAHLRDR